MTNDASPRDDLTGEDGMNEDKAPIMPMTASDDLSTGPRLFGGSGPWDRPPWQGSPIEHYARISPGYWIGAIALGTIIWAAIIRLL